jgi:hypothetical protein
MSCQYFFTGSFFCNYFSDSKNIFKNLISMKLRLNKGFNPYQTFVSKIFNIFFIFFETFETSLRKTEHNHFLE